jgi:amidohydrolase
MGLREEVVELEDKLRTLRRHFHAYPELGLQETKTCEYIEQYLNDIGVDQVTVGSGEASTAVIGLIHGAKPGPCIALRADMDALPIQEDAKVSYASKNKGVMHACGHDG